MQTKYKVLLLDAANTIIHKPDFWVKFVSVLDRNGIDVDLLELKQKHKLISEIVHFPDRTSKDFYHSFNSQVLLALGIVPSDQLLDNIHSECTYLPWTAFDDTKSLYDIKLRRAILSNFNSSIKDKICDLFGNELFDQIIGSEEHGIGKPNLEFYKRALDILEVQPDQILYIGDSLKLDVIPAQSLGIDSWLIDRDNNYKSFKNRITTLAEIANILN
ncbi:FMN phosphatase YigB (HAD superfamily) [Pedobacter sp. CAN_A7]|uniref:HAD family hydrolase n=1 Tax=Pedobacter sp. CAN_A7 TaxID=2787722 RepID=UPI0018CAD2CB